VPPFTFTTFDKPIFGSDGKPTFNMQTLKAQFQAPPQAGQYTFVMHLICDSYVGLDTKMEVTLVVDEASKAVEIEADEEISEPDEGELLQDRFHITGTNLEVDSLAGQMHTLKGGAPPKRKKKVVEESTDDESNTDEEVDDTSDTDTDTDTEDEA
jgi:translocation protein SEC63